MATDTDYSAMQTGFPLKSFIKKSLAKAEVRILDPFTGNPSSTILQGDPTNADQLEGCIVDCWTDKELVYFKKQNAKLLVQGIIGDYDRRTVANTPAEKNWNALTDEEVVQLVSSKYLALTNGLEKMTSSVMVARVLNTAKNLDKSEKYVRVITERLSELQAEGK
jgi:hypothetical protein